MRWLGVVLLVLLTVPATATAARVELRPGTLAGENELAYTAGADEVNDVHISRQSGQPTGAVWTISDPEAPPTERVPPCYAGTFGGSGGPGSTCPDDHVASIFVDLGDRDDAGPVDHGFTRIYIPVRLYGGPGRDRLDMHSEGGNLLDGGPGDDVIVSERQEGFFGPDFRGGADTVSGGEGNDMIRSRDLQRDVISCGPGHDEAVVDSLDAVDADCENVVRPYPPPPPTDSWVRADGRPVGVTINGSAKYTNSPDVVLTVLGPPHANSLLISNDGSFSSWDGRLVRDSERYRFRLESSGPDRLPKTVYVRFDIDPSRTFTDDIVLDQRRPRILRARLRGSRVVLSARDSTSGVKVAQFARARKRPWPAVKFRKRFALRRAPKWVRVGDRAGNMSRWTRVSG